MATGTVPTIGVLALQGDVREHLRALAACGAPARPVRRPAELDAVDALVIPGGESTTIGQLADDFDLTEPIGKRLAGGMPAYGSCAGMVMLAREILDGRPGQVPFGGIDMTVRRNAFGRQIDSFEADVSFDDGVSPAGGPATAGGPPGDEAAPAGPGARPLHAVFIRAPWVERVGPGVTVLGRITSGASAGRIVAVRQGPLLATAFHPELTGDLRVHRLFVALVVGSRPGGAEGRSAGAAGSGTG